MTAAAACVS